MYPLWAIAGVRSETGGPPQVPFLVTDDRCITSAVPEWLLAWMTLGASARRWVVDDRSGRLVFAISTPTRAFAAVAMAVGHAVADYRHDRQLPTRVELDRQVDALAKGELVRVVQPGWVRVARFGGRAGQDLLWLGR